MNCFHCSSPGGFCLSCVGAGPAVGPILTKNGALRNGSAEIAPERGQKLTICELSALAN